MSEHCKKEGSLWRKNEKKKCFQAKENDKKKADVLIS